MSDEKPKGRTIRVTVSKPVESAKSVREHMVAVRPPPQNITGKVVHLIERGADGDSIRLSEAALRIRVAARPGPATNATKPAGTIHKIKVKPPPILPKK